MATSQKLKEHYLTCAICLEAFTSASTLECEHTFCRNCLTKFTKTRPEAIQAKSIPCPFCRHLTRVPHPDRPVEEWAGQIKPGILMQSLLDDFGPGAPDSSTCSVCHEGGETTRASFWCTECETSLCKECLSYHRRMPASRDHKVCKLSEHDQVKKQKTSFCKLHADEKMKLFCKDCKISICNTCLNLNHRSCRDVVAVESMRPDLISLLTENNKMYTKKTEDEEMKIIKYKSRIDKVIESSRSAKAELTISSQKVVDLVRRMEKQLEVEMDDILEKAIKQLNSNIKSAEIAKHMYQQRAGFLAQALASASRPDLFDVLDSGMAEEAGQTLPDRVEPLVEDIKFTDCSERPREMLTAHHLGNIAMVYEGGFDTEKSPVLHETIDTKFKGDSETPSLVDILVMTVNGSKVIVVTDWLNTSVKSLFSKNDEQCHSQARLPNSPHNLTKLQANVIAITVHSAKQILFLKVKPELEYLSLIPTTKQYYGLTALGDSTLAAGCVDPPTIDILDMTGNVLRFLTTGQVVIKEPYFLSTTPTGNILVSNRSSISAICMTPSGDLVFTYNPMEDSYVKKACGIKATSTGDVLLVDREAHKVIQLSASGTFVRDVFISHRDFERPFGLCLDSHGRLYVTNAGRYLRVFRFE